MMEGYLTSGIYTIAHSQSGQKADITGTQPGSGNVTAHDDQGSGSHFLWTILHRKNGNYIIKHHRSKKLVLIQAHRGGVRLYGNEQFEVKKVVPWKIRGDGNGGYHIRSKNLKLNQEFYWYSNGRTGDPNITLQPTAGAGTSWRMVRIGELPIDDVLEVDFDRKTLNELGLANIQDLSHQVYIDPRPIANGGYGILRQGTLCKADGSTQPVVVKTLKKMTDRDQDTILKRFVREAGVWNRLNHENILPLLGLGQFRLPSQTVEVLPASFISPLIDLGDWERYQSVNKGTAALPIIRGIARGLSYLHSEYPGKPAMVHGDVKPPNVLISIENGVVKPKLCDFGLAVALSEIGFMDWSKSVLAGGSLRYMAVEVLAQISQPNPNSMKSLTTQADIWSFGLTIFQIFSLTTPFYWIANDNDVVNHVMAGSRPVHDPMSASRGLKPDVWQVLQRCWADLPAARPTASTLAGYFERIK